jgi:hypothetical protein
MKLRRFLFAFLISLAAFQFCFSQEKPKAVLLDEFGKFCSEEFSARLDAYISELFNNPTSAGYIVFYGEKTLPEAKNQHYSNATKYLTRFRRIDMSRIMILRGENRNEMLTQFWIVPVGAIPPKPEKAFVESKITSTKLFDNGYADFNRDAGNLDIYVNGFLDLGCDFSPNRDAFAKILLSNRNLNGYLIIYTKSGKGRKRAAQVANFALKELIRDFNVPRIRLKTLYGGNREAPEIEFWLVPKNDKPPVPKPDVKSKVKN